MSTKLMFALHLADNSDFIRLLFEGEEAEALLGETAEDLASSRASRDRALTRLQTCRDQKIVCEYKLKVFVSKEKVALGSQQSEQDGQGRRARMNNRKKAQQDQSYIR